MKFYANKINKLIGDIIASKINALLLYGPDRGFINKVCNFTATKLDILERSVFDQHISADQFEMLINSRNLFGKRECIKIFCTASIFNNSLKQILTKELFNFPIFILDEAPATCAIRKFFESEETLASMGCYYFDELAIEQLITGKFTKAGKVLDQDALLYLKNQLHGDYQLINNEIDKLIYFTYDKDTVTIDDAITVITTDTSANGDDLCVYFANQDLPKLLNELDKLLEQNINMVLIIRALIRYYLNIYTVLLHIKNGTSLDIACKTLSPPIFFKQIGNFKRISTNIKIEHVIKVLSVLQFAELEFKLQNNAFDFYQKIYLKIYS